MSFLSYFRNTPRSKHLMRFLVSGGIAYYAGGFVAGMVWCVDCGSNPFTRIFMGILMGLLSAMFYGFPPANEGGVGPPLNTWPYIFVCWVLIYLGWHFRGYKRSINDDS